MEDTVRVCKNQHDEQYCCFKIRYFTQEAAEAVCLDYLSRVLFSTMSVYFCRVHRVYHLGHDKRMNDETIMMRPRLQPYVLVA